jgi:hypothetical protein
MYIRIERSGAPAMTADTGENMVLRTVYLPPELDEALRRQAFHSRRSKGDLIREYVARGLGQEERAASALVRAASALAGGAEVGAAVRPTRNRRREAAVSTAAAGTAKSRT